VFNVDPSGREVYGVGLWPLNGWDSGFDSRLGHGCLSCECCVCFQVNVAATDRSLVQRGPTECGVPDRELEISTTRMAMPTRAAVP
jgi:hypothetical protein